MRNALRHQIKAPDDHDGAEYYRRALLVCTALSIDGSAVFV
jgi:hypothetical protein